MSVILKIIIFDDNSMFSPVVSGDVSWHSYLDDRWGEVNVEPPGWGCPGAVYR